ncbi:EAL domain-containing protein [Telluria aromaticivorans]|uniref:cyclic-guanylate-specific phosphodiesterase n=1 Tax=Telluria aromaticivorans TaxID=2725995 RepID=A0A7Y2JWU6_9BURK|nr:EAL domain-containing protein [Telluria aromaticivorans]NNG22485.1 EAL domain-containing protein [Telluria aromaticivorans]
MEKRLVFAVAVVGVVLAIIVPPWLAWNEAQRQAYQTESTLALGYAKDVLRRLDETGGQSLQGIERLERIGSGPCSPEAQALMRQIDLTSTYIQAIGHISNGTLICSSMGYAPVSLGAQAFRSSTGVILYTAIPIGDSIMSRLVGFQRGKFVALFHRDLPLDTWTAVPGVSLGVVHLDLPVTGDPIIHRGHVDGRWRLRLERRFDTTFVADGYLVAVVRSRRFPIVGIAAVPEIHLSHQTMNLAKRLVPASMLAGLALAVAIVLLARRQVSLANSLRQGLRHHEFFLAYQPVVELTSGRWVGVEALLRWRRPTGELIGPDVFIAVAEQTGTINRLTERVLELLQHDLGDFLVHHPEFHIALNLSAHDLTCDNIVRMLERLLMETGAKPANLIVEVTERALLDLASAGPVLAALRARGIEVAIDDFGTGYSSLSYLESLELDFLKIDRCFIETIGTRAPTSQVVQHIIAIARTMGLRMVAEGVETEAQARYLAEHGVQYAQGWLFAKAMSFKELVSALNEHGSTVNVTATNDR